MATVHLVYLVGFKNRVTTLFHWVVSFLGRQRSERTAIMTGDGRASEPADHPARYIRSLNELMPTARFAWTGRHCQRARKAGDPRRQLQGGWQALGQLMRTDPQDVGCEEAMKVLDIYVDAVDANSAEAAEGDTRVSRHICDRAARAATISPAGRGQRYRIVAVANAP